MFCVECGSQINKSSNFCTSCGSKILDSNNFNKSQKNNSSWIKIFLIIIVTSVLNSFFWIFILGYSIVDTEDQATSIIVNLLETVGRQQSAWENSESLTDIMSIVFTEECLFSEECVSEAISALTSLRSTIDKETEEIGLIWSSESLLNNFESFYYNSSAENQLKLDEVLRIYFPEDVPEVQRGAKLL